MERKKSVVLLSILLFSMLTAFLTIIPQVIAPASNPKEKEINSGMGRPYQDLIGVNASSDGINLTVIVWLAGAPPKEDNDRHIEIFVTIDTDNATNSGNDYLPLYSDAAIAPTGSPDGPGGGHYYWEYCVDLRRWTTPALRLLNFYPTTEVNNATAANTIGVTNSSANFADALFSPYTVNITIPLATIRNPKNVTLGVVTIEREGTINPTVDYVPPTNFAHVARDTIGNFSVPFTANWGQWLEFKPAIIGLLTSAGQSKSATDPKNDFAVLPCNDVTKVEVGQGSVIINVTMANMTYIWGTSWMYASRWQLVVAVDTDGIPGSGQAWIPGTPGYGTGWESGLADVRIDPAVSNTYWERAIVVDRIAAPSTEIYLYDTNFNNLGAMGITVTQAGPNKIKIVIPLGALGLVKPQRLNLTVLAGQDWYNLVNSVVGTWSYNYSSTVNTQGYYLVRTSIPPTEEILPAFPGDLVLTPTSAIGRPYQDIRGVSARSDGTNLYVNVTLDQGPPRRDNETHVNLYVAIDNGTIGGSWKFTDDIDVGYNISTYFWEYCLCLYNWTGAVQWVDLLRIKEYVTPPRTPGWDRFNATALGVTVTNSTDGKIVKIKIPYTAIDKKPSTVTLGVVTSEDSAKVKDTVGYNRTRLSISQWVEIRPAITALSTTAGSSASVSDPAKDFIGKSFWDITGVTVGMKNDIITVNATFQNVFALSWSMDQWRLAIGIDTDHAAGSGQNWMGFLGPCDTRIDESIKNAYWERCIVLDSPADIHLYDNDFFDWGSSGIWATLLEAENKISVNIPNWILPASPDQKLNLTILSGMDGGSTVYDAYGSYAYAYDPAVNTQGFYNLTTAIKTGVVMYPYPLPTASFNTAMGRPYQDITGVWAKSDGTNLNVSVTLREAPPRADNQAHVDIYVAIDTADGGQDWFPDNIDARYNISEPENFWEYCLALYDWTGTTPTADIIDSIWNRANAIAQGVTVTNSTDGRTVNMSIPLALIGSPSTVTLGIVTREDGSMIKDTVGSGTAILVGSQWIQVEPAIIDLSSAKSATDPTWDFCGKSFWDITEVKAGSGVVGGVNCLIVNVTFLDVRDLSGFWDQWWLTVEIDTDHLLGRGETWAYAPAGITGGTDTRLVNQSVSEWELCVVVNSPTDVQFYNVTGTYPSEAARWVTPPHDVTATLIEAQNKVQVAIPKSWLMLHNWTDYDLTLTVVSGTDTGARIYDIYGTYEYGYVGQYGVISGTYPGGFYVAHTDPSLNKTGPFKAEFSLKRYLPEPGTPNTPILPLYAVILNLDQWLDAPADPLANVTAYFYKYDGTYQGKTILNASITIPRRTWYSGELTNPAATPPGYQDAPIEIVEIVLDYGGGQLVIARFVFTRGRLWSRIWTAPFGGIMVRWGVAQSGSIERVRLFKELVDISKQRPYAP